MTDLSELIKRVEKAEGPSRELSDDILLTLGWLGQSASSRRAGILIPHWKAPLSAGGYLDVPSGIRPHPTASLDAIVALIEEKLPGWGWTVHSKITEQHYATLWTPEQTAAEHHYQVPGATPALALCLALLRALEVEDD